MNKYNPQIHHRRSIRLKGYDYSQAGFYFVTICCEDRKQQFGTIGNKEMVLNEFGTVAYHEWAKLPERFTNFELDVFQIMPNHMHGIIALVGAGFTSAPNDNTNKPAGEGFTSAPNNNTNKPAGDAVFTSAPNNNTNKPAGDAVFTSAPNNNTNKPGDSLFTSAPNDVQNAGVENDHHPNDNAMPQTRQPQGLPLQVSGDDNGAPARGATHSITIGDIVGAYKSLVANECLKIWKLQWAEVNPVPHMGKLWQRNYYEHIIRNEKSYQTISNYIINNPNKWKDDKFYKE